MRPTWCMSDSQKTGTTTDAYDSTTDLVLSRGRDFHIAIKNTGGANTLSWKVIGYVTKKGTPLEYEIKAEADLAPAAVALYAIAETWREVTIRVKAKVAASQTTFQTEACQEVAGALQSNA